MYYLVDFENVKGGGLYGIERLTKEDHVVVLYTRNANTLSIGEHLTLMTCACKVDFIELLHLGKNALDFQLVMMLGVLGGRHEKESPTFFIISGDQGYDVISEMNAIVGLNAKIARCRTIAEAVDAYRPREVAREERGVTLLNRREEAIRDLLLGTSYENRLTQVIEAIRSCANKDEVHQALGAKFKNEGTAIYKIIKPALTAQKQLRGNFLKGTIATFTDPQAEKKEGEKAEAVAAWNEDIQNASQSGLKQCVEKSQIMEGLNNFSKSHRMP